ncbi:MAG TPA: M23 family metallopeptidase [Gaiellaceae bacterium]|nr:M23 family metallopeptidase [Gaiellaceae bacterium]
MKRLVALLPVLIAFQAGAPPALAWTWPVDGPVLRPFSLGDDPYAAGQHRGVDVAAATGSPVRAPVAGTVGFAGTVPGGGRTITVLTDDGYAVTLVHLGAIAVTRNAAVAEGSAVGTIGPSGDAEHEQGYVHLGVRVADDPNGYLDPLGFLPGREVAPPPLPEPTGDVEAPDAPPPAPAPVTAPAPVPAEDAPAAPVAPAPAPAEPALEPAAETSRGSMRPAAANVFAGEAADPGLTRPRAARTPVSGPSAPPSARGGGAPSAPAHTALRFFELSAPDRGAAAPPTHDASATREGTGEEPPGPILGVSALAGVLAALVAVAVALARLRRGQLAHARPAHAAAAMLPDAAGRPAEDARRPRTAQEDRLVPHGDLEWIPLRESEALANLDRDDDPAKLIEVADDPCRRPATTVVANSRTHRARRHQPSRCRRPERLVAR